MTVPDPVMQRRLGWLALGMATLALACLIGSRVANATGDRVFNAAPTAPSYVQLQSGVTYTVSTANTTAVGAAAANSGTANSGSSSGAAKARDNGTSDLDCDLIEERSLRAHPTRLTALSARGSIHGVGTFSSPVTAKVKVVCSSLGRVWIDDAEDMPFDYAGAFLMLGVVSGLGALTVGLLVAYRRRAMSRLREEQMFSERASQ